MSDLFPVGCGEFLREGCDGVLELDDAGVSLGQRGPQALKLLRQTSELTFSLLQLCLRERVKVTMMGEVRAVEENNNKLRSKRIKDTLCVDLKVPACSFSRSPRPSSERLPSSPFPSSCTHRLGY